MGALEEINQLKPAVLDMAASGGHREAERGALGSGAGSLLGGGAEAKGLEVLQQGSVIDAENEAWPVLPHPLLAGPRQWTGWQGGGWAGFPAEPHFHSGSWHETQWVELHGEEGAGWTMNPGGGVSPRTSGRASSAIKVCLELTRPQPSGQRKGMVMVVRPPAQCPQV